jgi:ubiquinone biosynthesis protein
LPAVWRDELAQLQSEVGPFPYSEVVRIVTEQLGDPPDQVYATFTETPLAAASTAQVHRATLKTGEEVVVKVQRPDINITVRADLNVIRDLTRFAEQRFAFARNADIHAIISEYAANIITELDYTNEAFNGRLLAENMRMFPTIRVPKIYAELSTVSVMTQEFVRGVKITNIQAIANAGLDRQLLAQTFVKAIVKQVIYDGFFHGDPHPGNVLVDTDSGDIIFLDLGMMGVLNSDKRLALADLIWSLAERDGREVARTVLNLTISNRPVNQDKFFDDAERLLKRFTAFEDMPLSVGGAMASILDALQRHGLRMDPDLTLALKAMIQAEETAHTLDPDLNLVQTCLEATRDLFVETFDADKVVGALRTHSIRAAKQVLRSIPSLEGAVGGWMQQLMRGKFTIYLDGTDLRGQVDDLDKTISYNARRVAYALLLAGLLVGAGVASTSNNTGSPLLGALAYWIFIGAALCAAAVIVHALWRWLAGKGI